MKETKFRVWDKAKKEMFYSYDNYLKVEGKLWSLWRLDEKNKLRLLTNSVNGELMQFTGLKDKNGKEIYEGDIVICIHGTYEIVFTNGSFCLSNSKSPTIGFLESPIGNYSGENFKVIGNIYENPELLEGKK